MRHIERWSCLISLGVAFSVSFAAAQSVRPPIDLYSDMLMADAWVHGSNSSASKFSVDGRVAVLLATQVGRTSAVAVKLRTMGSTIEFADERVGYLRATMPVGEWARVRIWPDVVASQLDGFTVPIWTEQMADPRPRTPTPSVPAGKGRPPTAESATTIEKPFLDVATAQQLPYNLDAMLGVPEFRRQCPTCDGRGVTIAIVESVHLPLTHVAFSQARDLAGRPIAKIVDIVNARCREHLVESRRHLTSSETRVWIDGTAYVLPSAGAFEMGEFRSSDLVYPVLWAADGPGIWVDTNRDRDFRDEQELRDVRTDTRVGRFVESLPWPGGEFFAVREPDGHAIHIHSADSQHVAMTTSVATGADVPGNLAVGIAPAARVVLVDVGDTAHDYLEALLAAARHPLVDVISASMVATRNTPSDDGQLADVVVNRIVELYDKPVVGAAGNTGPIELADPAGARALSVGAYAHRASFKAMLGFAFAREEGVTSYSARGPALDGRTKPDLVAPVERVAASTCRRAAELPDWRLPPCYMVAGGTSSAAPEVAGLLGLLASGAKQRGLRPTARDFMDALRYTARYMKDSGAAEQGAGLVQVDAAWAYLSARNARPRISTTGPLVHAAAPYLASGGQGTTIYEREGWRLGGRGQRWIELVAHDLAARTKRYELVWAGNDGTFTAPKTVTLKRDEAVRVPIRIHAKRPGVTSALLSVRERDTRAVVHQQMVTIAVPQDLDAAHGWRLDWTGPIPWTDRRDYAIRVPRGIDALRVSFRVSKTAFVRLFEPGGFTYHRARGDQFQQLVPADQPRVELLPDPVAGTWYVSVAPYTAKERGGEKPGPDMPPFEFSVTVQALFADRRGSAAGTDEGVTPVSAGPACRTVQHPGWQVTRSPRLDTAGAPTVTRVMVGPDVRSLRFGTLGERSAHLYLYDCTRGTCLRFDAMTPAAPEQAIRVDNPGAGEWRVATTRGPGDAETAALPLQVAWTCTAGSGEAVEPTRCDAAVSSIGDAAPPTPAVLAALDCDWQGASRPRERAEARSVPAGRVSVASGPTELVRRAEPGTRPRRPSKSSMR